MPKFLFLNFPAPGHVNPTLPVVSELVAYGAEVTYVLPEPFRAAVEGTGARLAMLEPLEALRRQGAGQGPDDQLLARLPFELARQAPQAVPPLVELTRALQPDCIVTNSLFLWGRILAQITGVRAAAFRPYHAPRATRGVTPPFATEEMARLAQAAEQALAALFAAYRRPALTLQELVASVEAPTIVFMPKAFAHEAKAFDERFLFVGPSLHVTRPRQNFFAGDAPGLTRNVYISLGTLRNDDLEFYRLCLEAFEGGAWRGVLSVGDRIDIAALGPVPANFQVAPHVAQLEVLAEADVFVSHGGLNSTMESLFYGVPLVVMPATREQRLTARRVRELGLGVVLEREGLTAEGLRQAARLAATDPEMRARVREMRQILLESGGATMAAAALYDGC
jgi:MGT family glycosyltransferase